MPDISLDSRHFSSCTTRRRLIPSSATLSRPPRLYVGAERVGQPAPDRLGHRPDGHRSPQSPVTKTPPSAGADGLLAILGVGASKRTFGVPRLATERQPEVVKLYEITFRTAAFPP